MKKRLSILIAAAALINAPGCKKSPEQVWVSAPELDISFELTGEDGNAVTAEDYSGRLRLVFFGFASCPDVCPITLQNIGTALRSLGSQADKIAVFFISVDPKRDTPDVLKQYTAEFHPSIIGLTGTYEQLVSVASGFHTTFGYNLSDENGQDRPLSREEYESLPNTASYFPYHSSQVYLIGGNDELLDIIAYGSKPALIAKKIREHVRN